MNPAKGDAIQDDGVLLHPSDVALTVTPGSTFSTITVQDGAAFGQTFTFTVSVTTAVFNLN